MKTQAQIIMEELKDKFYVSDEEIAVKVKKSASAVWRWRRGKSNPSLKETQFLKKMLALYQKKSND